MLSQFQKHSLRRRRERRNRILNLESMSNENIMIMNVTCSSSCLVRKKREKRYAGVVYLNPDLRESSS